MTGNPEKNVPSDELHPRLPLRQLDSVTLENASGEADVSYQFRDGSELLDFVKIRTRRDTVGLRFENPALEAQFLLINTAIQSGLSIEEFDIVRKQLLPLAELDDDLVRHWIKLTRSFESKIKSSDTEFKSAAGTVVDLSEGYDISSTVADLDTSVSNAVDKKKDFRTASLLQDFDRSLMKLDPTIDIWLKLPSYDGRVMKAARLSGFAIHGRSGHTAVEPVIQGRGSAVGFIPESLYVQPGVNLRVGNKYTRRKS